MSPIIGEENLKEHPALFAKDHFNQFQDYDQLKWLKRKKQQEEQIDWKVEDTVQNVFKH